MSKPESGIRRHIQPKGIAVPRQPYSPVVRVGNTIYVAGQVPIDEERNVVGPGDPVLQAEQCWKNIGLCLESAGASYDDIVKVVGFFADLDQVQYEAAVRRRLLPEGRYPVASVVQAARVGGTPGILMEIEVTAEIS